MSKAIGLTLTITGAILAWWFFQQLIAPQQTPLPAFIVAAMSVAMISVGLRYIVRKSPPKKPKTKTPAKNPTDT